MNSNASSTPALAELQILTVEELEQARLYLQQTRDGILGATKGLSEAQWQFKPAKDRWSITENLDHVVLVQDRVLGPIRDQLVTAPPPPADYDYKQVDGIVINQFPVRLTKVQAPEAIHPKGQIAPFELLDRLVMNYFRLSQYLESSPDLRQHTVEALPLRLISRGSYEFMDGYQWILAVAAHTERHTKQILEVMADGNFPTT